MQEYIVALREDVAMPASLEDILTDVKDVVIIKGDSREALISATDRAVDQIRDIMGDLCIIEENTLYEIVGS